MSYYGDIDLEDVIDWKFTTVDSTGAPATLTGSGSLICYVGNSTTELTAGLTLTRGFDSRTGLNNVRVTATAANGYSLSQNYQVVVKGTVNAISISGYVVGEFSVGFRSALKPTTAKRMVDVSAGGEVGVDWANVGSPTTALDLSGTTIKTTQKVDVDTIKTNPVVNGGTITFPTTATLASTTNITAATGIDVTKIKGTTSAGQAGSVGIDWNAIANSTSAAPHVNVFSTSSNALTALSFQNDAISAAALDSAAASKIWASVIDGTNSAVKLMRGFAAALLGKASGLATTTAKYRDIADSKDVIAATVDSDGNRSAVTLDLT